jgi:hypothetical protein
MAQSMAIKLPAQRNAAQPRHAMCRCCAARMIISANSSVGCHPRLHADAAARRRSWKARGRRYIIHGIIITAAMHQYETLQEDTSIMRWQCMHQPLLSRFL